jgi:hypothetical protein
MKTRTNQSTTKQKTKQHQKTTTKPEFGKTIKAQSPSSNTTPHTREFVPEQELAPFI